MLDVLVQSRRGTAAAERLLRKPSKRRSARRGAWWPPSQECARGVVMPPQIPTLGPGGRQVGVPRRRSHNNYALSAAYLVARARSDSVESVTLRPHHRICTPGFWHAFCAKCLDRAEFVPFPEAILTQSMTIRSFRRAGDPRVRPGVARDDGSPHRNWKEMLMLRGVKSCDVSR